MPNSHYTVTVVHLFSLISCLGPMAAAAIVAIVPMLVFSIIAQKHIVKGLTLGSLKG